MYFATSRNMYLVSFQASNVCAQVWLAIYGQMKIYFAYRQHNQIFFVLLMKAYIYSCKNDRNSTRMHFSSLLLFFFLNENVFSYRSPSIRTLSGSIINGVVISCLLFISQIRTVCFWRGRRNVFLRGPDCKYMLLERTSSLPSVWVRIEEIPDNPYSLLFCLCQFLVWAVQ